MNLRKVLVVYLEGNETALASVKKILGKCGIMFSAVRRRKLTRPHFKGIDAAIVIGGDGTFIAASHHIKDATPIFGINPNPKNKEGFYTRNHIGEFEHIVKRLRKGKYRVIRLWRLRAKLNRKEIDHTLNELYVGQKKSYHTSRYLIRINGREEFQKSSGILIATATGSHSWLRSAGGTALPFGSDKFQLIVREYYKGAISKPTLVKMTLSRKQKITIISRMRGGVVVADSISKEHTFMRNYALTVGISRTPLHFISFSRGTKWKGLA